MKNKEEIMISDLRETLKSIIRLEIERLPESLEALNPKDRLNILCKIMPFVFPKVQNVSATDGEPIMFDNW